MKNDEKAKDKEDHHTRLSRQPHQWVIGLVAYSIMTMSKTVIAAAAITKTGVHEWVKDCSPWCGISNFNYNSTKRFE